jgi:TRAP-type C4-dicarboxylate transport system permease small subunit
MLTDRLPIGLQKQCAVLVDMFMAAICLFGVVYGTSLCLGTMGQTLAELPWLPVGITYAPLPLGALLTLIFVIERMVFGPQHMRAVVRFDHGLEETEATPAGA